MQYLRLVPPVHPPRLARDACVEAFDRELDYLFQTLRRLGAPASEIEDRAHDVFVVLHRNWPTLDTDRPLRPYLFGVAFRIVCAQGRRRGRERRCSLPDIEDGAPSPERELESRQSIALLLRALERVPLPRRAVVILHELDGVPVADIAKALSITRFAVYARLRKGRSELAAGVRWLQQSGVRK
ncbi:MAG: sigma-70 family RNA polymerase sigma factor [Polyangiaceae bacterium]